GGAGGGRPPADRDARAGGDVPRLGGGGTPARRRVRGGRPPSADPGSGRRRGGIRVLPVAAPAPGRAGFRIGLGPQPGRSGAGGVAGRVGGGGGGRRPRSAPGA